MKRILELNVGAMILLTFAVGCGGSSSSDSGTGGASASAGRANGNAGAGSANGNAGAGGASAMPGGGAHSGGQTSMPGTAGAAPGGGFMTSVPGTTPLKDLTPDQKTQLCSDLEKFSDATLAAPLADYVCKAEALVATAQAATDADAQTACKASLTGCTADPTPSMCTGDTAATCTATVADLSVCFNDTSSAVNALASSVPSCEGMTKAQAQAAVLALAASGNGGFTEPASCTKYDAECGSMTGM